MAVELDLSSARSTYFQLEDHDDASSIKTDAVPLSDDRLSDELDTFLQDESRPQGYIEHRMSVAQAAKFLKTDVNAEEPTSSKGLPIKEAFERLKTQGPNQLSPPPKRSAILQFLKCLFSLLNSLLIIAGIMDLVLLKLDFAENHSSEWVGPSLIAVSRSSYTHL